MMNKWLNVLRDGSLFPQRLLPMSWSGVLIGAILCLLSCIYALICLTDIFSAYVLQANERAFVSHAQQLDSLNQQIQLLEQTVAQRKSGYSQLYNRVLFREGRLSEKHIVARSSSRLIAGLDTSGSVNRSHYRYSPYHFDITMPSSVTAYELEQFLEKTELRGLGRSFVQAELMYGINAIFLTALAIHESHWGKSEIAREKHNLFGFAAYDVNPYQYAQAFESKHDCVLRVVQFIRENYIDGTLSSGRNIAEINRKYASDPDWSHKVLGLMMQIDHSIQR